MFKKLFLILVFTAVSLLAMNFQTASKEELMSIKGIGEKRAAAIMKYRRTHKIKSAADLENIPGIGKEIADNAKRGIKNSTTKSSTKKRVRSKSKSTKSKSKSKTNSTKKKSSEKAKKLKKKAGDKTKRAEKKKTKSSKKSSKKSKAKSKK